MLIPNKTTEITVNGGKRCSITSPANVCYRIFEKKDQIEIFLFDNTDILINNDKSFIVDEINDIIAYVLVMFDSEKGKMYFALSLDNVFEIKEIKSEKEIIKNLQGLEKMLEYCEKENKDLAYYNSLYDSNVKYYMKGKNGFIVKSEITNDYEILLSE